MIQTVSVLMAVMALAKGSVPHASVSTQYHAQDELGQYSYGYAGGPSSKAETKTADGVVRGEYSYIDANGIIQTAHYVADPHHGFRVVATNDPSGPLAHSAAAVAVVHPAPAVHPVAPAAHAVTVPIQHAAAHYPLPYRRHPTVYEAGLIPGVDTPEVQVARAAHLHAVAETKARDALVNHYPYPQGASYVPYAATHSHYSYYLPVQVKDTPEVAAAKAAHFAAVDEAKARIAHARSSYPYGHAQSYYAGYYPYASSHSYHVPVPVTDTPEVAAAKAAHYAAVHEAKSKAYQASYHGSHYPGYHSYASGHAYHVPVPVKDTPEVASAKAAHYAAVQETKARDAAYAHHEQSVAHAYPVHSAYAPLPVTDTPAVAHAKAAHFAAAHHIKAAHGHSYGHHW